MSDRIAIAIAAHPDDIEFGMAGTLCLLRQAGFETHYLNVADGCCGSLRYGRAVLRRLRRREAQKAAALLDAKYHESFAADLEILYTLPLLRRLTAIIRSVRPAIILTHSPEDYMEDHVNVSRLTVSAAFARGIPNFRASKSGPAWSGDTVIYHAMPHGGVDILRRRVVPGAYIDTTSVQARKLAALTCHRTQQNWLKASQGMNSYLREMETASLEVGRMSRRFRHAEGWRRHSHLGFGPPAADPLREALGRRFLINRAYERALRKNGP